MNIPAEAWMPLKLHSRLANTVEHIDGNIRANVEKRYPPLQELIGKKKGAVAVVGSGPSLKRTWKRLKNFKGDIMACNAAFQFLLERGITSTYMMCFDADPLMLEFITPRPKVTYLIASRCPPKAFEMLEGCNIICWHAAGDEHLDDILCEYQRAEPMVIGGTAAVTRAMILTEPLGYKEVHIFGGDSSFDKENTHIRQSTTLEKHMLVNVGARQFWCAPWMARQAEDFKILGAQMRDKLGMKVVVYGDGLIPHLARVMGFEVRDGEPKYKHWVRHAKWNAKQLWQQL